MVVDAVCTLCLEVFNGHWHQFPNNDYKCPKCGNSDQSKLQFQTDEQGEQP